MAVPMTDYDLVRLPITPLEWRACRYPERPFDPELTGFCVTECKGCAIVAFARMLTLDPIDDRSEREAFLKLLDRIAPTEFQEVDHARIDH